MRPGSPGFVGKRLKEAREARSLTQIALSDLLQVSRQAVSQYESNAASPHPDVLERISAVLRIPVGYFLAPIPPAESASALFYRSMSAATLTARNRAERRFSWLRSIVRYLTEFVEFPAVDVPSLDVPKELVKISAAHIEAAAEELRERWHLGDGPIGNMVYLLENHGCIVSRQMLDADTLDAFSQWRFQEGRPYVVLAADKNAAARSRFDAAHELGHLILHSGIDDIVLRRSAEFVLLEEQAHKFASAFLLPEARFCREFRVPTLDALRPMKQKWRVSIGAMLMRAKDLGLLSDVQAERLWRSYARRGWKRREPLDDEQEAEQPQLLRQSVELLVSSRAQSREQILAALPFGVPDIEELTGLPRGYLSEPAPVVRVLTGRDFAAGRGGAPSTPGKGGEVIPFEWFNKDKK